VHKGGKETRVSSFARLKCTPLCFGLAKFTFLFGDADKESRQAAFQTTILERGGD
jgi:hypothetical protein